MRREGLLIDAPIASKIKSGLEAEPKERPTPRTLREQLFQIECDIKLYKEFDEAEKYRFNRESYLWTAEGRIEWHEIQSDNTQRLRELFEERDALRKQLDRMEGSRRGKQDHQ